MSSIPLHLAVEDALQEAVLRRLLAQLGRPFAIGHCFSRGGFGYLRKTIAGFNKASRGTPFLVLTDLDRTECATALMQEWLDEPRHPNLLFRVAVRAVESWVMADRDAFAGFLGLSPDALPDDTDAIDDPKRLLVGLARRARHQEIRRALVPAAGSTARVGPAYNAYLAGFVTSSWELTAARRSSTSLNRAVSVLERFEPTWFGHEEDLSS